MALFRRRSEVPATVPDVAFPFWSAAQADDFRGLVRTAFAGVGLEVSMRADHAVDDRQRRFGLANLAGACHNDDRGRRAWPEVIDAHLRGIVGAMDEPSPFETWSDADVLASTYLRVMPTADLLPTMGYAREFAPGLAQVFNLDLPATVAYFTDEHVARFDADELYAAGLANLRAVAVDEHEVLRRDPARIDVLLGDSLFVASLILVLDEVVARSGQAIDPEDGVFVAVPFRHQLSFHVPTDAGAVASLNGLTGFAAAGYRDAVGPVSPDVYWWRPGRIEQLSRSTPDGPVLDVGADLARLLERYVAD